MSRCANPCPKCQGKTKALETRPSPHGARRRRECPECGFRFTTFEVPVLGIIAARGSPQAADVPDAADIAALVEVPDADEIAASVELPEMPTAEEIAEALWDESDRRAALGGSPLLELIEGATDDYDEDAG